MLRAVFVGFVFAAFCTACEPINRWIGQDDDWIGEEIVEEAIRYEFHVPVDLTPSSPE